jgi:asparagine synthase (glutamine-hydrolysing)
MCGICGILDYDRAQPVDRDVLAHMNATLTHRGPDSDGFYVRGPVALAMRRLAIIDVAGGDQPIANEDGSVVVVYNGEIYNYLELRAELEKCGHRFATHSDTEVIVHGYEQWGDGMLRRYNGMFALAYGMPAAASAAGAIGWARSRCTGISRRRDWCLIRSESGAGCALGGARG